MTAPGGGILASVDRLPRPLQGNYGISLTIAVFSLVPFIILTTAYSLFGKTVGSDLHIGKEGLRVISALGTAGYAFGAMLGGDVIQRYPQRRLFLIVEAVFLGSCLLGALSGGVVSFGASNVLIGFTAGLMLVIALPPVIRGFPPTVMPITTAAIDVGFFGAVTVGPLIGGAIAVTHSWRWLYGGFGGIGLLIILIAAFTVPTTQSPGPNKRFDHPGILLAAAATVLPFWASAELTGHTFHSYWFMVPLAVGFACMVSLLLAEYHQAEPLAPVKPMWHTVPVVGTLVAMIGGGAYVSFLELAERLASQAHSPLQAGLSFWPQVLGVIITSMALGALVRTRWLPILALTGLMLLVGGGAMFIASGTHDSSVMWLAATGLIGLGAGATVSPGLWLAGFSLPSKMVGRTFALVELVRSETDFILAPVVLQVAQVASGGKGPTRPASKTPSGSRF